MRDFVLLVWTAAAARRQWDPDAPNPEDIEQRTREVLQRCPPVRTDTGYDVIEFLRAAGAEFGFDAQTLIDGMRADASDRAAEHAKAIKAAEDLLRGEGGSTA